MPKQVGNAATTVAAQNISSAITPLVKSSREKKQLNGMEDMASMKEAWTPLAMTSAMKSPQTEAPEA